MAEEEKTGAPESGNGEEGSPGKSPISGDPEEGPKLTAREIDKMNVPKLKEAALQYKGRIEGVHGMDKPQLIRALKEINGIPLQEPKRASGVDRSALRQKIRALKNARAQHREAKDALQLKRTRRRIKALKRRLVRSA